MGGGSGSVVAQEVSIEEVGLTPLTAEELERIQQEAYQEGFTQGERDGLAAARDKITAVEATLQQTIAELRQLTTTLQSPLSEINEVLSQQVCDLAVAIAERIIRTDLSQGSAALLPLIQTALTRLPGAEESRVVIVLNPADVALMEAQLGGDLRTFRADSSLARGGVRLESGSARIDLSVEQQIRAVVAEIFEE